MSNNPKSKLNKTEATNLVYLFNKYKIGPQYEDCWFRLLLALARDKVKGFSDEAIKPAKVGRPPKDNKLKLTSFFTYRRRRGAPTKPKFNPDWVDAVKDEYCLSGHGSEKRAIEILVRQNVSPRYWKSEIAYFQKRLSDARKARKNPKNTD